MTRLRIIAVMTTILTFGLFSQAKQPDLANKQRFIIIQVDDDDTSELAESMLEAIDVGAYSRPKIGKSVIKLDTWTGDSWILSLVRYGHEKGNGTSAVYFWVKIHNKADAWSK